MTDETITSEQPRVDVYRLNDHLTAFLHENGWTAENECDFDQLNDLTLLVAEAVEKMIITAGGNR